MWKHIKHKGSKALLSVYIAYIKNLGLKNHMVVVRFTRGKKKKDTRMHYVEKNGTVKVNEEFVVPITLFRDKEGNVQKKTVTFYILYSNARGYNKMRRIGKVEVDLSDLCGVEFTIRDYVVTLRSSKNKSRHPSMLIAFSITPGSDPSMVKKLSEISAINETIAKYEMKIEDKSITSEHYTEYTAITAINSDDMTSDEDDSIFSDKPQYNSGFSLSNYKSASQRRNGKKLSAKNTFDVTMQKEEEDSEMSESFSESSSSDSEDSGSATEFSEVGESGSSESEESESSSAFSKESSSTTTTNTESSTTSKSEKSKTSEVEEEKAPSDYIDEFSDQVEVITNPTEEESEEDEETKEEPASIRTGLMNSRITLGTFDKSFEPRREERESPKRSRRSLLRNSRSGFKSPDAKRNPKSLVEASSFWNLKEAFKISNEGSDKEPPKTPKRSGLGRSHEVSLSFSNFHNTARESPLHVRHAAEADRGSSSDHGTFEAIFNEADDIVIKRGSIFEDQDSEGISLEEEEEETASDAEEEEDDGGASEQKAGKKIVGFSEEHLLGYLKYRKRCFADFARFAKMLWVTYDYSRDDSHLHTPAYATYLSFTSLGVFNEDPETKAIEFVKKQEVRYKVKNPRLFKAVQRYRGPNSIISTFLDTIKSLKPESSSYYAKVVSNLLVLETLYYRELQQASKFSTRLEFFNEDLSQLIGQMVTKMVTSKVEEIGLKNFADSILISRGIKGVSDSERSKIRKRVVSKISAFNKELRAARIPSFYIHEFFSFLFKIVGGYLLSVLLESHEESGGGGGDRINRGDGKRWPGIRSKFRWSMAKLPDQGGDKDVHRGRNRYCTVSNATNSLLSISEFEMLLSKYLKLKSSEILDGLNQVKQALNVIILKDRILVNEQENYSVIKEICPDLEPFHVFRLLSNFRTDQYDRNEISSKFFENFKERMGRSQIRSNLSILEFDIKEYRFEFIRREDQKYADGLLADLEKSVKIPDYLKEGISWFEN